MSESSIQPNRCKQIREDLGWSRKEMADKMCVEQSTIGNWETGKRQINMEKVQLMSKVTGFSILYILGFEDVQVNWLKPLSKTALLTMHRRPVWTAALGWGLVNTAEEVLVFADQKTIPLESVQEPIYAYPPVLAYSLFGAGNPLLRDDVIRLKTVWVEAISTDIELSAELRGWYHYQGHFVQNEYGTRFYLDTYGVKWLAFESCFPNEAVE